MGGGVFNRSAKSIPISPEMRQILGIEAEYLVPLELIKALLKAPVDLLWNGGIGTFVKATKESHLDVGDKANDLIRIDGRELNARCVGEGGNLGFTQLGRIEYSLKGGVVYTDFIDNSAGVNCSDHEVNIKILLNSLIANGKMTLEERNQLLEQMTNEVAELVLCDNYETTQILSLESAVTHQNVDLFRRFMSDLEKRGRLDRKLEFLPEEQEVLERKANNKPFTRPEIAILLSYSKLFVKQDILATNIPDDTFFEKHLLTAFPKLLGQRYFAEMQQHRLKREIIATQLSKNITDHMGINFVERLYRETGASVAFIIRAFSISECIYELATIWPQIEALDNVIDMSTQQYMMLQMYYLVRRGTRWFLRNRKPDIDIQQTLIDFTPSITELTQKLLVLLPADNREVLDVEIQTLIEKGIPEQLAIRIASCGTLFTSLDIVEASRLSHFSLEDVAQTYYSLGNLLHLAWLRKSMGAYPVETQWGELGRSTFRDDLDKVQRKLSISVLELTKKMKKISIIEKIEIWMNEHQLFVQRWKNLIADTKASDNIEFVTYSVLLRELNDFVQMGKAG